MTGKKKICIVSSCGGHLTEVRQLSDIYSNYSHFFVVNDKIILSDDLKNITYFISHSERDWKFFKNLWEAFVIMIKEKPTVLLSTGAGPIVPFAIVGKIFFRTKIVYIETITCIEKPSVTGRIMKYLSDYLFYQWPHLKTYFPKGEYIGVLL